MRATRRTSGAANQSRAYSVQAKPQLEERSAQSEPGVSPEKLSDKLRPTAGGIAEAPQLNDSRLLTAQRQALAAHIGRIQGNQQLQRLVAAREPQQARGAVPSTLRPRAAILQREDNEPQNSSEQPASTSSELQEVTVPVPQQQQQAASQPAAQPAAGTAPTQTPAEPPPVPQQARIRIPVQLKFELLPPELQIRLFDELQFTATVTAAQLAWQHERLKLGLGYDYGGAITGNMSYKTGIGTFSGQSSFDPDSRIANFGAGYRHNRWGANLSGSTTGDFSAGLSYGRALPPMPGPLTDSIMAGEQGGRNLLGGAPGLFNDPATLPEFLEKHGDDIKAVSGAAKNLGQLIDLTKQNTKHIDWGFYLRATYGQQTGPGVAGGVGVFFKRDEETAK